MLGIGGLQSVQVERWRLLHGAFLDEVFLAVFRGRDSDCESLDFAAGPIPLTQIARDGTLEGPDIEGLSEMLAASPIPVVASGCVGTLAHIGDLAALRVGDRSLAGAIVGRALYEQKFTIEQAVAATTTGA